MDGANNTRKYPGFTLAQLEVAVSEGRGTPAMLEEIEARRNGSSVPFVVPQIAPVVVKPEVSAVQIERLRQDWIRMAGENLYVEYIKGTFYAECSELAAYRIERKYNCRPKCEALFSKPRNAWMVRLETNL